MAVDNPFSKSDSNNTPTVSTANNSAEILNLLNEEDDESSKSEDKDEKLESKEEEEGDLEGKGEDEKKDEEKELELVEESSDEEKKEAEDEFEIVTPVSKKQIEKKFPGIMKEFPFIEAAIYKSQQYAEVFPTVNDAREASEKANSLDEFSADITNGDLGKLFATIKQTAPKALNKIADNLIQTINKVDENVALHIVGNVLKNSLYRAATEGKRNGNEDLQAAAKIISQFIFDDENVKPPSRLSETVDDSKDEQLAKERQQFESERFEAARDTLQTRVDNTIKATIDANIDPKGTMSAYEKKNAARDAFEKVEELLNGDKQFSKVLDNLWRSSSQYKYSAASIEKIRSAYLSKAKTVLRDAIRSSRNEALKGSGGKERNSEKKENRGSLPAQRSSGSSSTNTSKIKEIPKGMSNKDFIMAD